MLSLNYFFVSDQKLRSLQNDGGDSTRDHHAPSRSIFRRQETEGTKDGGWMLKSAAACKLTRNFRSSQIHLEIRRRQ